MRKMILFLSALLLAATASVAFAANCDAMNGAWRRANSPESAARPHRIDLAKNIYSGDRESFKISCVGNNLLKFGDDITRQYTLSADGMTAKVVYKSLSSGFTTSDFDMVRISENTIQKTKFMTYSSADGCTFNLTEDTKFVSITFKDARCENGYIDGIVAVKVRFTTDESINLVGLMIHGVFDGTVSKLILKKDGGTSDILGSLDMIGGCNRSDLGVCTPIDLSQYKIDDPQVLGASANPKGVKPKGKKKK